MTKAVVTDAAINHGYFIATSIHEISSGENTNEWRRAPAVNLTKDCRSKYDGIDHRLADGFTKVTKQFIKRTTARSERPRARLHE